MNRFAARRCGRKRVFTQGRVPQMQRSGRRLLDCDESIAEVHASTRGDDKNERNGIAAVCRNN